MFDFVQVIISGFPLVDGVGASLQIRITKDSRRLWLSNPRGLFNNGINYDANDEVCSGTTFWRALGAVTAGGGAPTEATDPYGTTGWTKSEKYDWAWTDPAKVFILQTIGGYDGNIIGGGVRALFSGPPGALARYDSKDEAKMSPDRRELTLRDGITVTGIDGSGSPVTYDFSTDSTKSFLGWLFQNSDSLTTWNYNRILNPSWGYSTSADFECYWMGDSKNAANFGSDATNFSGRTKYARQAGEKHITIEGGINRFDNLITSDVFPLIAQPIEGDASQASKNPGHDFSDWNGQFNGGAVQFVGGLVASQQAQTTDPGSIGGYFRNPSNIDGFGQDGDFLGEPSASWDGGWHGFGNGTGNGAVIACVNSNFGLHYMTLDTMLGKFATRAQMIWYANDCNSPLMAWSDTLDQTAKTIIPRRIDTDALFGIARENIFYNSGICYEAVFGSDPRCDLNVSEITTPVSLGWNNSISDALTKYAKLLFCKLSFPIDQTAKQQRLVLTSLLYLNTETGSTIPGGIPTAGTTSFNVTSGTALLAACTLAIGQDAATYLSNSGIIYAQYQWQGIAQTVGIVSIAGNAVVIVQKDSPLIWPAGTVINPVKLLPAKWKDGAKTGSDPATVSAKHVELSVKGDDDLVQCPNTRGTALSVEIAHGVRRFGSVGSSTVSLTDIVPNTKTGLQQQRNGWNPLTGGNSGKGHYGYFHAATVFGGSGPDYANFNIFHSAMDARGYMGGPTHIAGHTDICAWHDLITGAVGYAFITAPLGRNKFEIGTIGSYMPQPTVGNPTDFLIGVTSGALNGRNDCGWLVGNFDITIGAVYGTPLNNGNTLITKAQLIDGLGVGTDIYNNPFLGQSITLPKYGVFRMANLSWDGTYTTITLDRSIPFGATGVEGRVGLPEIASDGWAFASYLYYMNGSDKRFSPLCYGATPVYGDNYGSHVWSSFRNQFDTDSDRYSGAYTLSRFTVGPPEGTTDAGNIISPSDSYGTGYYALAQAFARKYIGIYHYSTRTNFGVLGNDGGLASWANGDSFIEQRDGAVRFYAMEGHEMNEMWKGNLSIRAQEWPDLSAPLTARRYPVLINGGASTSGGAGGGGGNGGGGGSPSGGGLFSILTESLSANQNDWPLSLTEQTFVYVSASTPITITGLANGAFPRLVTITNTETDAITLTNEDAGSVAANQFHSDNVAAGAPIVFLTKGATVTLFYDTTLSRWRVFSIGGN